jgi:hypothetical protein
LAGLILFGGGAEAASTPYNMLINPGAETGDLTGWHLSNTGYKFVVSTNQLIPYSHSNYLARSGAYTFQLFDTTADTAYIYQDFAAIAGSQWSASCYAISYASNYFSPGANAHLQVVFYGASNQVVASPDSSSGTAGVYGSDFLDPSGSPDPATLYWIFAPPPAIDASGWVYLQPTNLYASDPATELSFEVPLTTLTTNLVAPAGTALVRYQIEFDNVLSTDGPVYWDDCVLNKLNFSDPDITNPPVATTVYVGAPAAFTVGASHTGAYPVEKLSFQWQRDGTNLPPGGINDISGSTTTATLTFTNCQTTDSGLYAVVVTVKSTAGNYTNSIRSVPVALTVFCSCPRPSPPNRLGNPGFENAPFWTPWSPFNGCNFTRAYVFDGSWAAMVGANGDRDNGFHQPVTGVAPGSFWKAGGWAYISSLNDFAAGNTCRLQVWFKDANGVDLAVPAYESFKIYGLGYTNADAQYTNIDASSPDFGQVGYHAQLPRDQWVFMPVTNVVNNAGTGLGDDLPDNTLPDGVFVAPPNAAQINFQVYEYCPVAADNPQADLGGSALDAVYWDDMQLIQVVPVTDLTASSSANKINLFFSARAELSYAVLYKTNLSDASWNTLTNVAAPLSWQINVMSADDTFPLIVSDPLAAPGRFYRVKAH